MGTRQNPWASKNGAQMEFPKCRGLDGIQYVPISEEGVTIKFVTVFYMFSGRDVEVVFFC
jgi:hypothetical protein